ncbi:unnamed protein product [Caenorhabditis angaria]|uniref:Arrestin C-terminal-like domain-containing protein n=1 Tax=Caenorhabditis angaria TaxID=860376 RepID=A0A9P1ID72_9PELO|nr:unnamed protein product [Caenorhabditis angaria]
MGFDVQLERPYYQAGQLLEGQFTCDLLDVDLVEGRILGEAEFNFSDHQKSSPSSRILVDERVELWRYCTLSQLLGLDENQNQNQNENITSDNSKKGRSFPIRILVPKFAPPTFQCAGSPINVKYFLQIRILKGGEVIGTHEEPLVILGNSMNFKKFAASGGGKPIVYRKDFYFSKDRSISAEIQLKNDIFSTTDKIETSIKIGNQWKQSLKYVHLNIVRRISTLNFENEILETIKIDTTGVGLPSSKHKISVGEAYTFQPSFNIPALPPNIKVDQLFRTDYSLKISIGRAHNFILSSFEIPITITTNELKSCRDSILVDISATSSINNLNLL